MLSSAFVALVLLLSIGLVVPLRENFLANLDTWVTPSAWKHLYCPPGYTADHIIPQAMGGPSHPCNYVCMPHNSGPGSPVSYGINNAKNDLVSAAFAGLVGTSRLAVALACTYAWGGNHHKPQQNKNAEYHKLSWDSTLNIRDSLLNDMSPGDGQVFVDRFQSELTARPDYKAWNEYQGIDGWEKYVRDQHPGMSQKQIREITKKEALSNAGYNTLFERRDKLATGKDGKKIAPDGWAQENVAQIAEDAGVLKHGKPPRFYKADDKGTLVDVTKKPRRSARLKRKREAAAKRTAEAGPESAQAHAGTNVDGTNRPTPAPQAERSGAQDTCSKSSRSSPRRKRALPKRARAPPKRKRAQRKRARAPPKRTKTSSTAPSSPAGKTGIGHALGGAQQLSGLSPETIQAKMKAAQDAANAAREAATASAKAAGKTPAAVAQTARREAEKAANRVLSKVGLQCTKLTKEGVIETAKAGAKQALKGGAKFSAKQATKAGATTAAAQAAKEAARAAAKAAGKGAAAVGQAGRRAAERVLAAEAAAQAAKEAARAAAKAAGKSAAAIGQAGRRAAERALASAATKHAAQAGAKEAVKVGAKEVAKAGAKEAVKVGAATAAAQAAKEAARAAAKAAGKNAAAIGQAGRRAAERALAAEAAKNAVRAGANEALKTSAKEAVRAGAHEAVRAGAKEVAKVSAQEVAKVGATEGAKKAAGAAAAEAIKNVGRAAPLIGGVMEAGFEYFGQEQGKTDFGKVGAKGMAGAVGGVAGAGLGAAAGALLCAGPQGVLCVAGAPIAGLVASVGTPMALTSTVDWLWG